MPYLKRTIKATDVIRDLRSGMTLPQLMEKHKVSVTGIRLVFRKLLNAGVITKDELDTQVALYRDATGSQDLQNP